MIYNIKPKSNLATFAIVFKGSTNFERKGIYGIAHLMEHLQCKNFDHLIDSLDTDGIQWNAYTSNDEVAFYFSGLSKYLAKYKHELYDAIPKLSVTEETLESERKIVLQEYEESFSDNTEAFQLNWYRGHWGYFNPIGLRKDIETLTLQNCIDFHELQYRYPSMVINIDHDIWSTPLTPNIHKPHPKFQRGIHNVDLEPLQPTDQKEFLFVSPIPSGKVNYYNFICKMFVDGLKSPLYQIIREDNQLCYRITMDTDSFNCGADSQITMHLSSTEDKGKVEEIVRQALNKDNLTRERFDQCKQSFFIGREMADENKHADWEKYLRNTNELITTIAYTMTYEEMMDYASQLTFDMFTSE